MTCLLCYNPKMKKKIFNLKEHIEINKLFKKDGLIYQINKEENICEKIYKGYLENKYNYVEFVEFVDESLNITAIYCEFKEYEFITYCFVFKNKEELMIGIVPEIQEYLYIKQNWLTKLLGISSNENEGEKILKEFKDEIKKIGNLEKYFYKNEGKLE